VHGLSGHPKLLFSEEDKYILYFSLVLAGSTMFRVEVMNRNNKLPFFLPYTQRVQVMNNKPLCPELGTTSVVR
jgi:hypothetical protein